MIYELQIYLQKIVPAFEETSIADWGIEMTPDETLGDYASNVAFRLARSLSRAPLEVAQRLVTLIREKDVDGVFADVALAPPGFINFRIASKFLLANVVRVVSGKPLPRRQEKIILEFISANPTGPLTIANGRGGFLGDVLSKSLTFAGYKTYNEYYINDAGLQVRRLGESALASLGLVLKNDDQYQGDYVNELAQKFSRKIKNLYDKTSDSYERIGQLVAADLLQQIKSSIKKAGIHFDGWFSEYDEIRKKNMPSKILTLLKSRRMIEERDGAVWLKTVDLDDDKDRVLVKTGGEPTYFLPDLAYHYNKFITRKFDCGINILGADHHGYVARLKAGVGAIGIAPARLNVIVMQMVRLVRGGEEVRMSKRQGEFVTLDELLKEVGVDAARFFFLMHAPNTHMDFDLDLAKERSMKNPVYYAQYAYVRCRSILGKSKIKRSLPAGRQGKLQIKNLEKLQGASEIALMRQLVRLPDVVLQVVKDYQAQRLTTYTLELAQALHRFYESERVITDDKVMSAARLTLVAATASVFEQLFKILGISAPKKM